jgi:AcrR family transcriptional regulator
MGQSRDSFPILPHPETEGAPDLAPPENRGKLDRDARRRKVQRAAARVFAERGYARATIEEIARRAGLSVGAIYLYFQSKEDLYASLAQDALARFADDIERRVGACATPGEQLRAVWDALCEQQGSLREFFRMVPLTGRTELREAVSQEVTVALGLALARFFAAVERIAARGIEQGVFRADAARIAADLVCASFTGMVALGEIRINLLGKSDGTTDLNAAFVLLERALRA